MDGDESAVEVVVAPREIDLSVRQDLEDRLSAVAPEAHLVIDLTSVTFCDSSALGVLLHADARQSREGGGTCTLRNVPSQLHRLLEITNLEGHFTTD